MKNFKLFFSMVAVTAILFISCSKDEHSTPKATVSFGAVLNDVLNNNPQARQAIEDIPDCSDSAPAFVDIVITGTDNIGTIDTPLRVSINSNLEDYDGDGDDEYVTAETEDLKIRPGTYTLEYFVVYDADDNPIWVAPNGGAAAEFVANPLPQSITLVANTDNFLSVDVVCFDNRELNEFGDLYFGLEPDQAIEFCVSGDFCATDGTASPANFSVNIWNYNDDTKGTQLYTDVANTSGEAVCFALPDIGGADFIDNYYFEITFDNTIIREGALTDADVKALFEGDDFLTAYKFKEGSCASGDSPALFGETGGSDPDPDPNPSQGIALPYIENFEAFDPANVLAPYNQYQVFALPAQTVSGDFLIRTQPGKYSGPIATRQNFGADAYIGSDGGMQYTYNAKVNGVGFIDNTIITPQFAAQPTDVINFAIDMEYKFNSNINTQEVRYYYSSTYDGTTTPDLDGTEWTIIDFSDAAVDTGNFTQPNDSSFPEQSITDPSGTAETLAKAEAQGYTGADWKVKEATITPGGSFYIAIRYVGAITDPDNDKTQWQFDNLTVEVQ
jgi:hypothetical protein